MKEVGGLGESLLSDKERAAVKLAETLTAWPGTVQESDLDELAQFFSSPQIVELVLAVAIANLTNRFTEGLKIPIDV